VPSLLGLHGYLQHVQHAPSQPTLTLNNATTYAVEIMSLKAEIDSLKATIAMAVEQFKLAIQSLALNPRQTASTEMDTNAEAPTDASNLHQTQPNVSSLIHDLKQEIATFVIETRALLHHQSIPMSQTNYLPSKT